ncbi:MAG: hypothetical protein CFE24_03440 [Flavobacterium sp. BFFFF2]|nr:MAG: hypothetical protein CFE24_03440 [Flavobacterium sp. BFFFF2]
MGCEKDDICDPTQSTTPRIVLEFHDVTNPNSLKNVANLKVIGIDESTEIGTYNGVSKIKLPLKITADQTTYKLISNSTDNTFTNTDILQFSYTRQTLYVSRACGYKMVYTMNANQAIAQTDNTPTDGYWMQQIILNNSSIQTENETHVIIYF